MDKLMLLNDHTLYTLHFMFCNKRWKTINELWGTHCFIDPVTISLQLHILSRTRYSMQVQLIHLKEDMRPAYIWTI